MDSALFTCTPTSWTTSSTQCYSSFTRRRRPIRRRCLRSLVCTFSHCPSLCLLWCICLYFCLSVCLSCLCMSVALYVCLSVWLSVCMKMYVCMDLCLSVCLSDCLTDCLSVFYSSHFAQFLHLFIISCCTLSLFLIAILIPFFFLRKSYCFPSQWQSLDWHHIRFCVSVESRTRKPLLQHG